MHRVLAFNSAFKQHLFVSCGYTKQHLHSSEQLLIEKQSQRWWNNDSISLLLTCSELWNPYSDIRRIAHLGALGIASTASVFFCLLFCTKLPRSSPSCPDRDPSLGNQFSIVALWTQPSHSRIEDLAADTDRSGHLALLRFTSMYCKLRCLRDMSLRRQADFTKLSIPGPLAYRPASDELALNKGDSWDIQKNKWLCLRRQFWYVGYKKNFLQNYHLSTLMDILF